MAGTLFHTLSLHDALPIYSVSGLNDGYKQCTWNGQNLSVLSIDETSVANASSIIEKVLGGEDYETVQAYVDSLNADKK